MHSTCQFPSHASWIISSVTLSEECKLWAPDVNFFIFLLLSFPFEAEISLQNSNICIQKEFTSVHDPSACKDEHRECVPLSYVSKCSNTFPYARHRWYHQWCKPFRYRFNGVVVTVMQKEMENNLSVLNSVRCSARSLETEINGQYVVGIYMDSLLLHPVIQLYGNWVWNC
jgi:hypothetical protein